ncbi:Rne/Rng family ribonuclease [uncultured delta proteobacterium]|uniref:Ribonuclease G n=1 Tax=uncultured delta proteobacterium TaxID=34034 RepID=A0A212JV80_9DELT|nr:Rne/Rng family ribonuclease [uncultured delta proteobacterium]
MTQENDSAASSGKTPDQAAAPAKKAGATPKKTTARKTASPKTAPAKKAAAPTKEAAAQAGEKTAPAKKPRAAAKPAAKTTSKTAPATGTDASAKAPAKAPAKPLTATASKTDGEAAKNTAKTPAKKAPARPRGAAKPKTAPVPVADAAPAQSPAKETAAPAAKMDTPAQKQAAPAKTDTVNADSAGTPRAPESKAAKPRNARRGASPKKAAGPAMEKQAEPAAKESAATTRAEPPVTPAASQAPASAQATLPATGPEARTGDAPEAPAKPASRRSRRGGRRRNKSRAAAAENAAAAAAATPASVNAPETADPATEAEATPAATRETAAEMPEKAPGAKPEPKTGDSGKHAPKAAAPKTAAPKTAAPKTTAKDKKAPPKAEAKTPGGKQKMFISVLSGELVEVVLAEEGVIVEYYVEMQHQAKVKGNIYKGVVSNIDANLQAAFISYAGGVKNGFLQIDEVHPEYYISHHDAAKGRKYPPIQKVLKPGQEILVQVVKEPAGTKGAFLTSYLSLPGRFLVLTPGREQIGVSRKVEIDEERVRLRGLLEGLNPGPGLGVIVRTASTGATKTSLQRDLLFLKRLWKDVRAKGQTSPAPGLIYEELDLSTRAVRDYLTEDVQEVWVDDVATADQVTELASLLFPKKQDLVQVHQNNGQTLFERFSLQKQLDQIHSREVSLPSGGSLVIDKTEALTAIDINSGRSSGKTNFEDMAYRTNMEAAKAIPLQLRLRDIGGQIVADFIEMRDRDHWREVEKVVRNGMKGDRARYDVGKIGPFGMLEIVRQRLGSSAISISTEPCPCCKGTGIRRNLEWQAMQALRDISKQLRQAAANNQTAMTYPMETELAFYVLNAKRAILQSLEAESGVALSVTPKTE